MDHIVSKILLSCMKLSEKDGYAASSESGMSCNLFALFIIFFFNFKFCFTAAHGTTYFAIFITFEHCQFSVHCRHFFKKIKIILHIF